MSVRDWQAKLNSFGYSLKIDGIDGPRTYSALFSYMGAKDTAAEFGLAAHEYFPKYQIEGPLRVAHFLAQATAETCGFRYLTEIWGPTEAQQGYEGAARLGNTQPGDGFLYRGRGIFQITGRRNYASLGPRVDLDLIDLPQLAARADVALELACLYWSDHKLNDYADANNVLAISNGINRGNPASIATPNGYAQRKDALRKARLVLS